MKRNPIKLDKIFENEKYELLMSHSSDGVKMKMMFDGSQDAIDEIIVYGRSDEMGLGVARILGDDMNVSEIMAMIQEVGWQGHQYLRITIHHRWYGNASKDMKMEYGIIKLSKLI